MKKIKVLHIVPTLSPGGAERVAVHIVTKLNGGRYEAVMVSLGSRLEGELDYLLEEAGIEVRYLGKPPGFDYRMYPRLHRVFKEYRPDVIHTHIQVLRYALPSMRFLKHASVVHTVHNLAEREIEPRARWIHRYAFTHGVVPVAVAQEVAVSLERVYGIKECRVVPNGIPTGSYAHPQTARREWREREGFRDNDVLFVCVARFSPQKNHALLLKAFAQGPASDPNAHLVVVGDGDLREQLHKQAKDLGLVGQIHFLGLRTDIPDVLGAMDVFVLSSDWEGNPLSVMEAMASGLPILSTAVGGVPDLCASGREGLLVQPGDLQRLSEAMAWLLRNREARHFFGMGAARRARENFDVSTMVRSYEELYDDLVQHSSRLKSESLVRESVIQANERVGIQSQ